MAPQVAPPEGPLQYAAGLRDDTRRATRPPLTSMTSPTAVALRHGFVVQAGAPLTIFFNTAPT
ncbi:hypothetical protein SAMN05216588_12752 [Pseudomonas flavescens]|uniref:Uncharacterized protein n=1 Tax=Phytopseudomonas flavescens TaxID=29435 RepID=A0A1G8P6L7_9GAMM|nr:hypothetical protein SAMN05216588_12752 [Pseudomonas flavescens]